MKQRNYDTPAPISVTLELGVGDIRIAASDRADTVVEVRPSDPASKGDVAAAEQTEVDYSSGRLVVKSPKGWRQYRPWGGRESVDVEICLPSGSDVAGDAGVGALHVSGRAGEVNYSTGVGDVDLDEAGPVRLKSGVGTITAGRISGSADIKTGSGAVEVGAIDGSAVIKNSNGDTRLGEVGGDLRVQAANGRIAVDESRSAVVANTSNGDIRLGTVSRGTVAADTACGRIEIGVLDGVAAWLELNTHFGNVESELDSIGSPPAGEETVEVRARTAFGDITVRKVGAAKREAG
jgi:hypothetical protein